MAAALEQAREVELEGHCWCLSGAAPRRFASVGVRRPPSRPRRACGGCWRRPARAMGHNKAAPSASPCSRWGPLASGDASGPDVGRLRSRPGGLSRSRASVHRY